MIVIQGTLTMKMERRKWMKRDFKADLRWVSIL